MFNKLYRILVKKMIPLQFWLPILLTRIVSVRVTVQFFSYYNINSGHVCKKGAWRQLSDPHPVIIAWPQCEAGEGTEAPVACGIQIPHLWSRAA